LSFVAVSSSWRTPHHRLARPARALRAVYHARSALGSRPFFLQRSAQRL